MTFHFLSASDPCYWLGLKTHLRVNTGTCLVISTVELQLQISGVPKTGRVYKITFREVLELRVEWLQLSCAGPVLDPNVLPELILRLTGPDVSPERVQLGPDGIESLGVERSGRGALDGALTILSRGPDSSDDPSATHYEKVEKFENYLSKACLGLMVQWLRHQRRSIGKSWLVKQVFSVRILE